MEAEIKGDNFVCLKGTLTNDRIECVIGNVYASSDHQQRQKKMYESLGALRCKYNTEWIIGGDWNEVLSNDDRSTGAVCEQEETSQDNSKQM